MSQTTENPLRRTTKNKPSLFYSKFIQIIEKSPVFLHAEIITGFTLFFAIILSSLKSKSNYFKISELRLKNKIA